MWKAVRAASRRAEVLVLGAAVAGCTIPFGGAPSLRSASGALASCDPAPHCVSSEAMDDGHRVLPFHYDGSLALAHDRLLEVIKAQPRATIEAAGPDYIHAVFRSATFHFIDDVEFVFGPHPGTIQVRSASRDGYYDFGANRDRVETLREAFDAASAAAAAAPTP